MGFPTEMFTVLFAIPRVAGWLAHWQELIEQDSKIYRPRQLWTGHDERTYISIGARAARRSDRRPPGPPASSGLGPHVVRSNPSCTTDTARAPSRVKIVPVARPRAPTAVGLRWS